MDQLDMAMISDLFELAVHHHQSSDLRQAEACCRQILRDDPAHAAAHHLLGLVVAQSGHPQEAIELIRRAIALNPADADGHFNLAMVHMQQGQAEEALACFRRVVCIKPDHDQAHNNLGNVLMDQGQLPAAIECYRQALRSNPHNANAYYNLGNAFIKQGRPDEAIACFRDAIRISPTFADAYNNLGTALQKQGEAVEAIACYRKAIACNPLLAKAQINLGQSLTRFGLYQEAQNLYEHALRILPGNATALWNCTLLRLLHGDFEGGWQDYEKRWALPGMAVRSFHRPRWDGSSFLGKTNLVYAEQGLGDTIQFLRYLPLVKERGGTVLFECQAPLVPLCTGIRGADQLIAAGAPLPHFDVQVALLSLPGIFRTNLATIPKSVPYLRADPGLVEYWRKELQPLGGFKIGIAWQGNPKNTDDRYRSVPLAHFETLARREGVRLVSLQQGPGAEQLKEWARRIDNPPSMNEVPSLGNKMSILDLSDRLGAFIDTAAVMMNLNLVVTVDNAVAHVAGALGVPTWTLLPYAPDWRWLLERSDSPWYPTMRLFRQSRFGDWSDVFERVHEELR
jgi:tetratricopeptide (TPR) repeat protein